MPDDECALVEIVAVRLNPDLCELLKQRFSDS